MKIKISRSVLLNNLSIVQKALPNKSNLPALTCVHMNATDEGLVLITSNGDLSIKCIIEDNSLYVDEKGTCLIPGKSFIDLIRKFNGEDVSLELEQDSILRIQSGSSDALLNLFDVTDYPETKFVSSEHPIEIDSQTLKEIIKETTFAASSVATKPILTGVNFRILGNKLSAVSTDSFRLSKRNTLLEKDYLETNIIIPAKSLNELTKTIEEGIRNIEIHLDRSKILFKFGNVEFQSNLLDGNYPDTSRLIPNDFPIIIKFNKMSLMESIDRVSTLSSNPNVTSVVRMVIDSSRKVNLSSNSVELGTIKDTLVPEEIISFDELTISFSSTFFLDALKVFDSEEVIVKFTQEQRPFIFEAEDDPGLVELLLPMKSD